MTNVKKNIFILIIIFVLAIFIGSFIKGLLTKNEDFTKSFDRRDFSEIDIQSDNAAIILSSKEGDDTTIDVQQSKENKSLKFDAKVKNDTLVITLKEPSWKFFKIGIYTPPELNVVVPHYLYESIAIKSNNGKINLENIQADDIQLHTDNGKVVAQQVEATEIELTSANGKIDVQQVKAKDIEVSTANGKIQLEDVEGDLEASTNTGKIQFTTAHLDRNIDFSADVGKIEIFTQEEPTNATISVSTSLGSVDLFGENKNHLQFGEGKYKIELETEVGKTSIQKVK